MLRKRQVSLSRNGIAGFRREPSKRELTERRLVAFAEQLEDVSALREVVIRRGVTVGALVHEPADPEELAPVAGGSPGVETILAALQAAFGVFDAIRGQ